MPGYVIPTNGFKSLSYKKCQGYQLKANNIIINIFYGYLYVLTVESNVWIRSMYVIFLKFVRYGIHEYNLRKSVYVGCSCIK